MQIKSDLPLICIYDKQSINFFSTSDVLHGCIFFYLTRFVSLYPERNATLILCHDFLFFFSNVCVCKCVSGCFFFFIKFWQFLKAKLTVTKTTI